MSDSSFPTQIDSQKATSENPRPNETPRTTPAGGGTPPAFNNPPSMSSHSGSKATRVMSVPRPQPLLAWVIIVGGDGGEAGHAFSLMSDETVIGRGNADIDLNDLAVSSLHAKIVRVREGDGVIRFMLFDMGSANGTWVDDEEVYEYELQDGTRFRLGKTDLAFKKL